VVPFVERDELKELRAVRDRSGTETESSFSKMEIGLKNEFGLGSRLDQLAERRVETGHGRDGFAVGVDSGPVVLDPLVDLDVGVVFAA